ncbi:phosphotransferase family protein [Mesorhizobium australicum]|uniref:Predicted kinase, aminoglycoside phosphotransferase (APT) family n=1 Tax=Mesorhizobium australicum TaxID=536018 RepID=A0A1X7N2N4_9HYPH|nr:phosphotransferase family protein [Mesorhizobium australicum]SMH30710.1 Predicted kinase, aminoglycoside phosphotransferase (APT) family [Mesorhizobium australicum]
MRDAGVSDAAGSAALTVERDLAAWVEAETGGTIADWHQISGGNRARSWAVKLNGAASVYLRYQAPRLPSAEPYTVWREAEIYRALNGSDVVAPRLLGVHDRHQAIITELKPGRADFRSLRDDREKQAIAFDFVAALAAIHRIDLAQSPIPGFRPGMSMSDCVRAELDVWAAMYSEVAQPDPLTEFALDWLYGNLPDPDERPVLVHGDAGPGNFLFDGGRMTGLIDWELAHAGDPMEDLAWFSMRSVMEPVPDFIACVRQYEKLARRSVDLQRILYHRVFVSARVVIIRHRNVTGLPGNSIVSRALNRRLLVDALAEAMQTDLPKLPPLNVEETAQGEFYDGVIQSLRDDVADVSMDASVRSAAKNNAKVIKYLREVDRLGPMVETNERAALQTALGEPVENVAIGRAQLLAKLRGKDIPFGAALSYFHNIVTRDNQMAALASGGLASRHLPDLSKLRSAT